LKKDMDLSVGLLDANDRVAVVNLFFSRSANALGSKSFRHGS